MNPRPHVLVAILAILFAFPTLAFGQITCLSFLNHQPYDPGQGSPSSIVLGETSDPDDPWMELTGNGWRSVPLTYTVTPNTVLELDFTGFKEGEVHGIGFETDNSINGAESTFFQVWGTQSWGIETYPYTGTSHIVIPVGQHSNLVGTTFTSLTFGNDHDAAPGDARVRYSNVFLHEGDERLSFLRTPLTAYGGAGQNPPGALISSLEDCSTTLAMSGNGWLKIQFETPYDVTANTRLEFDYQSTLAPEVSGIGFDNDDGLSPDWFFQVFGTDVWGYQDFDNYSSPGSIKSYSIPVGQYFQGSFQYLFFANDHDGGGLLGNGSFSNIRVYEGVPTADTTPPTQDSLVLDNDNWLYGNNSEYNVTTQNTDTQLGVKDVDIRINHQGSNSANRRGYFSWRAQELGYEWSADRVPCSGGGWASKHPTNDNPQSVRLVGCQTSLSGQMRTITLTIQPTSSFGVFGAQNDISMRASDGTNTTDWQNYDLNFRSDAPNFEFQVGSNLGLYDFGCATFCSSCATGLGYAYYPSVLESADGLDVFVQGANASCNVGEHADAIVEGRWASSGSPTERVVEVTPHEASGCSAHPFDNAGAPDALKNRSTANLSDRIVFYTKGSSDAQRGRIALAYDDPAGNWTVVDDQFLLYPLCYEASPEGADSCLELGVSRVSVVDYGQYFYIYFSMTLSPDGGAPVPSLHWGAFLMRVEKASTPPYVVFGAGSAQLFNHAAGTWHDLAYHAGPTSPGYYIDICGGAEPNLSSFADWRIHNIHDVADVTRSTAGEYIMTYHMIGENRRRQRHVRSLNPEFPLAASTFGEIDLWPVDSLVDSVVGGTLHPDADSTSDYTLFFSDLKPGFGSSMVRSVSVSASYVAPSATVAVGQAQVNHQPAAIGTVSFPNPIAVAGPPSFAGSQPAVVRAENVSATGFDLFIDEWDYLDGFHAGESVGYLVVDAGPKKIGDLLADADVLDLDSGWKVVTFQQKFTAPPVVFAMVASHNEASAVTTRIHNVTSTGFQIRLQEEEGGDGTHAAERVHWIAIEPGVTLHDGRTLLVSTVNLTNTWQTVSLTSTINSPALIAAMQTLNGGDTAALRYRNLTSNSFDIFVEEETSGDAELNHIAESVGYLVISNF